VNRFGRIGACAALIACLFVAGCQSKKPPEGVRVYPRQEVAVGDALISVEGTSAALADALKAAGGSTVDADSLKNEAPPEGSELVIVVATLKNVGPAAFWTTAADGMPEVVDSDGTPLPVAENWYTSGSDVGEPESGPRDGQIYLESGGTIAAVASFFVRKDEPDLKFTWSVSTVDTVKLTLKGD